jgi:hypothetical protein
MQSLLTCCGEQVSCVIDFANVWIKQLMIRIRLLHGECLHAAKPK